MPGSFLRGLLAEAEAKSMPDNSNNADAEPQPPPIEEGNVPASAVNSAKISNPNLDLIPGVDVPEPSEENLEELKNLLDTVLTSTSRTMGTNSL